MNNDYYNYAVLERNTAGRVGANPLYIIITVKTAGLGK